MQSNENKCWNDHKDLQDLLIYLFEQNADPGILEATMKGQQSELRFVSKDPRFCFPNNTD